MTSTDATWPADAGVTHPWPADRLALALLAGGVGTWEWDRRSGRVGWDANLERLYGLPPGSFGGRFEDWVALLHPDDRDDVLEAVERSVANGAGHEVEHRIVRPDGSVRWIYGKGIVVHEDGRVTGMLGVAIDITQRREAEAERSRLLEAEHEARERLEFLARASAVLAESLDTDTTLQQVADLAVPWLADCCSIALFGGQRLDRVTIAHRDPDKLELAHRLRDEYGLPNLHGPGPGGRSGEPEIWPEIPDGILRRVATDERHYELLKAIEPSSALVIPLRARGHVLGVLTLLHAESGRRYGHEDLVLAEELARRAAVAVDNARLFQERTRVARVLQRTLLPPDLPEIPGCDLAARHEPAASGWDISGDFYDAFENVDGTWALLIGDVRGKGPEAAALTGLARHTVRAAALRDADPGRVLSVLNQVLLRHECEESFCTAIMGVLRPAADDLTVRLATAGHPPALTVRAGGGVEGCAWGGVPVGLFDAFEAATDEVTLRADDALVLHTDGVVEARRGPEQFGSTRLRRVLSAGAGASAAGIADRIIEAVVAFSDGQARDDTAVLVARAGPLPPVPRSVVS